MPEAQSNQQSTELPRVQRNPFRNKWTVAILLSVGLAMDYEARVAINSVFPMLRRDLLMTNVQIGLTAGLFLWTYGLLSPLAGYTGDRFSRRTLLIGSVAFWSVATILSAFATSPWQLIAMRMALASAEVFYMPTALAFITDFHTKETQGKGVGIFQAGSYVGIFLAGFPAAYLATRVGWRGMLVLSGGAGLLCAGLLSLLPRDEQNSGGARRTKRWHRPPTSIGQAISILRKTSILNIMLAFALFGGASWTVLTYLPLFIYDRYHFSLELAAFQATFYMQVTAMVSDPILGHISDAWSGRNAKNRFYFGALAGLAGLPALTAIGWGNHTIVLIVGLLLFGMASAAADVSWMPMLTYVTTKYQRATAFGYLNMASCLAGGLCAMLAGLMMKTFGLGVLFACGGGLLFLLAVVLIVTAHVTLPRDMISHTLR